MRATHSLYTITMASALTLAASGQAIAETNKKIAAGAALMDGEVGVEMALGRHREEGVGLVSDGMVRYIDFGPSQILTTGGAIGIGAAFGERFDQEIAGVLGVRFDRWQDDNHDDGSQFGGYGKVRYRVAPIERINLGVDVAYTDMGDFRSFDDRTGITADLVARLQLTGTFGLDARYLADIDDVEGEDRVFVGLSAQF